MGISAVAVWLAVASATTEDLDVDLLTLTEARAELVRLETPPTRVGFATMLGVGLVLLPTGIVGTLFSSDFARMHKSTGFLGGFDNAARDGISVATGIIGFVGLALSIAGGVLLFTTTRRIDDMEVRSAAVRARIAQLEGHERVDPTQLHALEREILTEQRPSMGFAGGMVGGGCGALAVGFITSLAAVKGSNPVHYGALVAGIGELAIGVVMIAVGITQFVSRTDERSRLDARLRELGEEDPAPPPPPRVPLPDYPEPNVPPPPPPPPQVSLPPAPVLLSYTFTF